MIVRISNVERETGENQTSGYRAKLVVFAQQRDLISANHGQYPTPACLTIRAWCAVTCSLTD